MSTLSRDIVERRIFAVVRPAFIVFLLVICLFPFYYMVMLSFRPLDAVLQDPGALVPRLGEIDVQGCLPHLDPAWVRQSRRLGPEDDAPADRPRSVHASGAA